jgi:potassium-transporting ATPase KdpC subunit
MNDTAVTPGLLRDVAASLRITAATMLVCCVLYGGAVLAFAQAVTPRSAEGSLILDAHGNVRGSTLIAQRFTQPGYFRPRPSAVEYNAAAAGGSNLSPANPALRACAQSVIAQYGASATDPIPADLVTASGSGLDPHITLAAARFQAARVAQARGIPVQDVVRAVNMSAEPLLLAGDTLVSVLRINMLLDGKEVGDAW